MSEVQSQPNEQNKENNTTRDSIYIGKKPLMAYVTSTLIQLANQPSVTIKARGLSIGRAVDVSRYRPGHRGQRALYDPAVGH